MCKNFSNYSNMTEDIRSRGWSFVINNWTIDDCSLVSSLYYDYRAQYVIGGFEEGDQESTPHIQGYVYWKDAKSYTRVLSILAPNHIENADPKKDRVELKAQRCFDNYAYCSKDDSFYEIGRYPEQGKAAFYKIRAAMRDPKKNFQLHTQYVKTYRDYLAGHYVPPTDKQRVVAIGLSLDYKKFLDRQKTYYFDVAGYNGQKQVFIDASNWKYSINEEDPIVKWAEGWPKTVPFGYQQVYFDPDVVFVSFENDFSMDDFRKKTKSYIIVHNEDAVLTQGEGETICPLSRDEVEQATEESSEEDRFD